MARCAGHTGGERVPRHTGWDQMRGLRRASSSESASVRWHRVCGVMRALAPGCLSLGHLQPHPRAKEQGGAAKGFRLGRFPQEGRVAAKGRDDLGESSVKLPSTDGLGSSRLGQVRHTPTFCHQEPRKTATHLKTGLAGWGWQTGSGPRGHRHTDAHSARGPASTQHSSGRPCAKRAFRPHLQ